MPSRTESPFRRFITALALLLFVQLAGGLTPASAADDDRISTTVTYTGPTSGYRGLYLSLSATITTEAGSPLSDKRVRFAIGGSSEEATTDETGTASTRNETRWTSRAFGTHTLTVAFAGDATYRPAQIQMPFEVTWERTFTDQAGGGQVLVNSLTAEFRLVAPGDESAIKRDLRMFMVMMGSFRTVTIAYRDEELVLVGQFVLTDGTFSAVARTEAGTYVLRGVGREETMEVVTWRDKVRAG